MHQFGPPKSILGFEMQINSNLGSRDSPASSSSGTGQLSLIILANHGARWEGGGTGGLTCDLKETLSSWC